MASANDKIPEMTSWISRRMDSEEPLKVSELVGFLPLAAILTLLFISVAAVFNLIYRLLFARRVTAVGSKTTSNEKSLADLEELQRKLEALETLLNSPSRQTAGQDLSVGHRLEILFTKVGLLEGAHTQAIIDQGRLDRLESSISNISRDRHPDLSASSSPHGGPPPPPPPPPPLQKIEPVVIVPTTKKPKIEPEGPVTLGASMSDVLLEMSKKQRKIVQMISSPRSKYLESRVNTTKIPQRESALRIPIRSDSDDETSQDVADKKPKSPSERHGVKRRSSSTTREPEVREVAAGKPVPDLRKSPSSRSHLTAIPRPGASPKKAPAAASFLMPRLRDTHIPRSPGGTPVTSGTRSRDQAQGSELGSLLRTKVQTTSFSYLRSNDSGSSPSAAQLRGEESIQGYLKLSELDGSSQGAE